MPEDEKLIAYFSSILPIIKKQYDSAPIGSFIVALNEVLIRKSNLKPYQPIFEELQKLTTVPDISPLQFVDAVYYFSKY